MVLWVNRTDRTNIYMGHLFAWLTKQCLGISTWLFHIRESTNLVVDQPGYLSSPNLVPKAWKILGELLVFNQCWKPEKSVLVPVTATRWMDLPVRVRVSRQRMHLISISFYLGCHQKMPHTFRVGLPSSNNVIKGISPRSSQWLLFGLIPDSCQVDNKN